MPGDGQFVMGVEAMLLDPIPVHLGAIAAVEIANVPVALDELKLAMTAGNVGEPEDDIRTLSAPDGQDGLEKRNRITAADRMSSPNMKRGCLNQRWDGRWAPNTCEATYRCAGRQSFGPLSSPA